MTSPTDRGSLESDKLSLVKPGSPALEGTWWDHYSGVLGGSGLSDTAREVIDRDSKYIVEKGLFGAGAPNAETWPQTRTRRGLVMGAVQSGKTASMLGVSAQALDAGVDAIIVLAGTRTSLWRQTFDRLTADLDLDGEPADLARRRTLLPTPGRVLAEDADLHLAGMYDLSEPRARRMMDRKRPLIAVVMKNVHHLRAMGDTIKDHLVPVIDGFDRPFHLVVLDDEADDGSILDAQAESGLDHRTADLKQIPRKIVDLWERRPHPGYTASLNLYVTYVGYTATPQANFLQADYNPLAPKDFTIALRTPADRGEVEPRSTTYLEPEGLRSYYTGGEIFYRALSAAPPCVAIPGSPDDLADAMRAFLVAGAVLAWRAPDALGPASARGSTFATREQAVAMSPAPHSMLIHPSVRLDDHFAEAARVLAWAGATDETQGMARLNRGERNLPCDGIRVMVEEDPDPWVLWLDSYGRSAQAVQDQFDLVSRPAVPTRADWPEIKRLLVEEIVPGTRVAVINSDERADDRPEFSPHAHDGEWRAARNLSTVFVSGNVMSRGLTLEGLTTTLFERRSSDPYADTQMQMQRWFGYRGTYFELCRVFLSPDQVSLFRSYHDTDEAMRRDVIGLMNEDPEKPPSPEVLQGHGYTATGKLTNLRNIPLCPGANPFIRWMNSGQGSDPNAVVVARLFEEPSHEVPGRNSARGRLLDRSLSLRDAANLLDSLRYEGYNPVREGLQGRRWATLERQIALTVDNDFEGLFPLYRPPATEGQTSDDRLACPYAMAAYLRLWGACLSRHARGLWPTEDWSTPWSMVDLEARAHHQPKFRVGMRFGNGSKVSSGPLSALPFPVHPMRRTVGDNSTLEATWGAHNSLGSYAGDEFFDYYATGTKSPAVVTGEVTWRPVGDPGQLLFHVIEREGGEPTIALGVGIPLGGPDQFAARSPH